MRNINKSEIRYVIRRAIEAFTQGRDALAVLNAQAVNIGLAGGVGEAEGRRLQTAYTQRGEEGAVATAIAMLRDFGYTVTDDEAPEVPLAPFDFADAVAEPVVEAAAGVDLSAVAQAAYENLLAGGRASAIAYLNGEAARAGITLSAERVEKIVTDFAEALGTDGLDYAEEILEAAYAALTATPEAAPAGDLEARVARLEQIARDNGLL